MSVNAMKKLTVIAPATDVDLLLRHLIHLGCVELIRGTPAEATLAPLGTLPSNEQEIAERVAHIDRALPILQKRQKKRRHPRPVVDPDAFLQSEDAERAKKTIVETEKLLDTIASTKEALGRERELMRSLLPYLDFSFPLHELGTKTTVFLLGRLPVGTEAASLQSLADDAGFIAEILCADKSGVYIAAITHRVTEDAAREALVALGFTEAAFADTSGRAVAVFDAAHKRAEKHEADLTRFDARLDVLAENFEEVSILADIERTALHTAGLKKDLLACGSCALLTAWCPAYEAARVEKLLLQMTVAFELTDPAPTERPPCPVAEPPYRGAFSSLFATYRTPWHGQWNPAVLLTTFYILIFGLLFADVGLGLVAIALSLGTLLLLTPPAWLRRAILMLCACGIACLPFGVLCGNYFGDLLLTLVSKNSTVTTLAPFPAVGTALTELGALLQQPRIFWAVALIPAAIYLLTVMTLRTVRLCRVHRALEALLIVGPHLLFSTGIGLFWLHPIAGAAVTGTALIAIAITGSLVGRTAAARLIAIGGRLLDLLLDLAHALTAARPLALGAVALPCLLAINALPTAKGKTLLLTVGMLLTFALAHALNLAINALPSLAKRAKLCYMARFSLYYPHRDTLHRPLRSVNRYIIDASLLQAEDGDETATDAASEELPPENGDGLLAPQTATGNDGSDGVEA